MPEHNSQQLLYAAANTGQLRLALQQAQVAVDFPRQYGAGVMADGERGRKGGEGGGLAPFVCISPSMGSMADGDLYRGFTGGRSGLTLGPGGPWGSPTE
jgi:hypothetical protein